MNGVPILLIEIICFVLETVRTGTVHVVHIAVKTEETQMLRIKFVLVLSYLNLNTTQHLTTVCTVLSYLCLQNTSKSTFPSVNRSMILTTNKSTILPCQQIYTSSSRSISPPLGSRHILQSTAQVRTKRRDDTTSHLSVHGRCWTIASILNFPISIHNTDTAPRQGRSNIRHCSSHSRTKHPTNNIRRSNSPCMIQTSPC